MYLSAPNRQRVVGVIEDVEELRAELNPELFRDLGILRQSEVCVVEMRTSHGIPTQVAERSDGRHRKCGRVKPTSWSPQDGIVRETWIDIGTGTNGIPKPTRVNPIDNRQWQTRGGAQDATELPAFDGPVAVEGQRIQAIDSQSVRDVVRADTPIV